MWSSYSSYIYATKRRVWVAKIEGLRHTTLSIYEDKEPRYKDTSIRRYYALFYSAFLNNEKVYVLTTEAKDVNTAAQSFYKAFLFMAQAPAPLGTIAMELANAIKKDFQISLPSLLFVETVYRRGFITVDGVQFDYNLLAEGSFVKFIDYIQQGIPFVIATASKKEDVALLIEGENKYFLNITHDQLNVVDEFLDRIQKRTASGKQITMEDLVAIKQEIYQWATKKIPLVVDKVDRSALLLFLDIVPLKLMYMGVTPKSNIGLLTKAAVGQISREEMKKEWEGDMPEIYTDEGWEQVKRAVRDINKIRRERLWNYILLTYHIEGMSIEGQWLNTFKNEDTQDVTREGKVVDVLVSEDAFVFPIFPNNDLLYSTFKNLKTDESKKEFINPSEKYIEFVKFFDEDWPKQWGIIVYTGAYTMPPEVYLIKASEPKNIDTIFNDWRIKSVEIIVNPETGKTEREMPFGKD